MTIDSKEFIELPNSNWDISVILCHCQLTHIQSWLEMAVGVCKWLSQTETDGMVAVGLPETMYSFHFESTSPVVVYTKMSSTNHARCTVCCEYNLTTLTISMMNCSISILHQPVQLYSIQKMRSKKQTRFTVCCEYNLTTLIISMIKCPIST